MRLLTIILILSISIIGCSSNNESLLDEDKEKVNPKQGTDENQIVFGEKIGERQIDARNVFRIGEPTHFIVSTNEQLDVNEVTVVLRKYNGEEWSKLTEAPLEVKPEWKQFMNGLPAKIYKQTGTGAYKLEVLRSGELLAKGEFVINEKD